ncbi:hypothetical protein [Mycolicibacterium chitae]|nr:hypothetical protein [Mycolicibacterium chitae]MCV7104936.1 hypothetical protein [Mycolicibacterium chitae]
MPLDLLPDGEIRTAAQRDLSDRLQAMGFSDSGVDVRPEDVLANFGPIVEPLWEDRFKFSRDWLQRQVPRLQGLVRGHDFLAAARLNVPAEHALMFRTLVGLVAVTCQLEAEVALRDIVLRWYPEFAEPKIPPAVADALGTS